MMKIEKRETGGQTIGREFKLQCEEVRKVRILKGVRQYLVKWKNLDENMCSWEEGEKLGMFRRQVEEFNRVKKYEIEWMQRQYCILNHKYLRKYPLQPFILPTNENYTVIHYGQQSSFSKLSQNHDNNKNENPINDYKTCRKRRGKDIDDDREIKTKKKRERGKKKIRKSTGKQKQKGSRRISKAGICEQLEFYEDDIEKALQELISKQKQQQNIPQPPPGYQKVDFQIGINHYSSHQIQTIQPKEVAHALGDNQFEEIDHYKDFFKGKYSIYHYRQSPADSDSSYPPKDKDNHSSLEESIFDSGWSNSKQSRSSKNLAQLLRRKLNLSERKEDHRIDDRNEQKMDQKIGVAPLQDQDISEHSQQQLGSFKNQEDRMMAEEQQKQVIQEKNQQYNIFSYSHQESVLVEQSIAKQKDRQNGSINGSASQIYVQEELQYQDRQVQMNDLQHQSQIQDNLVEAQPENNEILNNIELSQEVDVQFQNIQLGRNEQRGQLEQRSVRQSDRQIKIHQPQDMEQVDIEVQQMPAERQEGQSAYQKYKSAQYKSNHQYQQNEKQNDRQRISGRHFNKIKSFSFQECVFQSYQNKISNPFNKSRLFSKTIKRDDRKEPLKFTYNPLPVGSSYFQVRKNIDENTLTFTEMCTEILPTVVKILDEVCVDGVNYVYCLFWSPDMQLFEKFIMLIHFKQFYQSLYEQYKQGHTVKDILIHISDMQL